ncbi:MAG: hypothetical protein ACI80N_003638 [Gammaproteobacteria bacterium]|jgi:hypothetical protein
MSNDKKLTEEEMKKAAGGFSAQKAGNRAGVDRVDIDIDTDTDVVDDPDVKRSRGALPS